MICGSAAMRFVGGSSCCPLWQLSSLSSIARTGAVCNRSGCYVTPFGLYLLRFWDQLRSSHLAFNFLRANRIVFCIVFLLHRLHELVSRNRCHENDLDTQRYSGRFSRQYLSPVSFLKQVPCWFLPSMHRFTIQLGHLRWKGPRQPRMDCQNSSYRRSFNLATKFFCSN